MHSPTTARRTCPEAGSLRIRRQHFPTILIHKRIRDAAVERDRSRSYTETRPVPSRGVESSQFRNRDVSFPDLDRFTLPSFLEILALTLLELRYIFLSLLFGLIA